MIELTEDDPATPLNELEITQESHYYPFGMNHLGPWYETVAPENKYLYNGIEMDEDYGIKQYSTEFRNYDPALGRWLQIDPIHKFHESPFAGFANNPVLYIDPWGTDTLKQIGHDTYDGGYLDGATVTAKKSEKKSKDSNNSSLSAMLSSNRFSNWKPTGTGSGLSVNPDFPQYSEYAEGIKNISWNMLSPFLMGVAGAGGAEVGGARIILQRFRSQMDFFRISRAFRFAQQNSAISFRYADNLYQSALLPIRRAPRGGIFIGERFYAGGQFLPGARTVSYSRVYAHPEYLNLPALGNSLRPSPIFYPSLSPATRWAVGGGGAAIGLYWGLSKTRPK